MSDSGKSKFPSVQIDSHASYYKYVVPEKVQDVLYPVDIHNVKLGGEIGRRVDVTMNNNIKKLHLDKNFISHFQEKTGPAVAGSFIGMGMLIDATTRFAAYSADPEMISLKNEIIDKVIGAQLDNGYSGFYRPERRLWDRQAGSDNWDIHEMAFIIDGLITDYQLFGSERSLEAAVKTADFIISQWDGMPDHYDEIVDMHVLDTGIDWAILKLYKVTGDKRFLNFNENQKPIKDWDTKITIGRRIGVSGHMFAYFAMCVAQLELYRLTGNEDLLSQTQNAIEFFVANDGLTITGSAGQREIWTDDQDGEGDLGETCATAYQLRVYNNLLRLTGNSKFGDLIERTVFNGLFGAQSPGGEKIRYHTPFEGTREFYPIEYMCCPGNFRRIMAKLPEMVYFKTEESGIAVNLYTPSSASITDVKGINVQIQQNTDYPTSEKIDIVVNPDNTASFPVLLRIPSWVTNAKVKVKGMEWNAPGGQFLKIHREWTANDRISLEFPMEFRFVRGRKRNAGRVALMRGPVIYSLNLKNNPEATNNGERNYLDLRRIQLDPETLTGPFTDESVRPDGTAAYIKGWREKHSGLAEGYHEFNLKLTEFPDPESVMTYFKIPDYSIEVEDELVDRTGEFIKIEASLNQAMLRIRKKSNTLEATRRRPR